VLSVSGCEPVPEGINGIEATMGITVPTRGMERAVVLRVERDPVVRRVVGALCRPYWARVMFPVPGLRWAGNQLRLLLR
jgi:hypothetical protein